MPKVVGLPHALRFCNSDCVRVSFLMDHFFFIFLKTFQTFPLGVTFKD